MQTTIEQIATRPFHEVIVEVIRRASSAQLECLATLIKATNVPKGHDEIIVVWNKRRKEMFWGDEDLGVPANLLEQKQTSAKKAKGERKGINLNGLQRETEKLLALLKDRHLGLIKWNEFMHKRLQNLHKLTSQALGK